jgi:hypothetical protein
MFYRCIKVQHKPINIQVRDPNSKEQRNLSVLRNGAPDCPVCHRTVSSGPPDSVRCTRTVQLKPATLGFLQARSAIIHRTVRCASGATAIQRNSRLQKQLTAQTVRARSQSRSQRRTGQCPVWHRTIRCHKRTKPPTVDCSRTLMVR